MAASTDFVLAAALGIEPRFGSLEEALKKDEVQLTFLNHFKATTKLLLASGDKVNTDKDKTVNVLIFGIKCFLKHGLKGSPLAFL